MRKWLPPLLGVSAYAALWLGYGFGVWLHDAHVPWYVERAAPFVAFFVGDRCFTVLAQREYAARLARLRQALTETHQRDMAAIQTARDMVRRMLKDLERA